MDQPNWRQHLRNGVTRIRSAFTPVPGGDARETTPAERKRAFQILFFSLLFQGSGQSIMFAILPPVSRALGFREFQVGLIFAVSALIWIFSSPYWGRQSDIYGRRPIMLMGIAAFAISTMLFALVLWFGLHGFIAGTLLYTLLIASRSIFGIFGSGTFPAATAYIADRTSREERVSGVATINAAFGLGVAIGPGIGAVFMTIDLIAPFVAIAVAALIGAAAIYLFLPERTPPRERDMPPAISWRDNRLLPFLIFGTILNSVGAIPIQTFGFLLMDGLHMTSAQAVELAGIGLMAMSIASLLAQFVLVQRFHMSSAALIRWGVGVGMASNLLFVFGWSYGILVFAMVLSGLGFGMARPGIGAAASLAVRPDEQGAAAGLIGATGGAGFIFAPVIGTLLYEIDPRLPYLVGTVLMAGLLIFALVNARMRAIAEAVPEDTLPPVPKG